jgi:hypothetical protein
VSRRSSHCRAVGELSGHPSSHCSIVDFLPPLSQRAVVFWTSVWTAFACACEWLTARPHDLLLLTATDLCVTAGLLPPRLGEIGAARVRVGRRSHKRCGRCDQGCSARCLASELPLPSFRRRFPAAIATASSSGAVVAPGGLYQAVGAPALYAAGC